MGCISMGSFTMRKRADVAARALKTMAETLQALDSPNALRGVLQGLQEASTLLQMCLYENQKQLIQNAAYEYDSTEVIV